MFALRYPLLILPFFCALGFLLAMVVNLAVCNPSSTRSEPSSATKAGLSAAAREQLTAPWLAECLLRVDGGQPSDIAAMLCVSDLEVRWGLEAVPRQVWDDPRCKDRMLDEWKEADLPLSFFKAKYSGPFYYYAHFMCHTRWH